MLGKDNFVIMLLFYSTMMNWMGFLLQVVCTTEHMCRTSHSKRLQIYIHLASVCEMCWRLAKL